MKTLCIALSCKEKVERHPSNFGTGFCVKCQKKYDWNVYENILKP